MLPPDWDCEVANTVSRATETPLELPMSCIGVCMSCVNVCAYSGRPVRALKACSAPSASLRLYTTPLATASPL